MLAVGADGDSSPFIIALKGCGLVVSSDQHPTCLHPPRLSQDTALFRYELSQKLDADPSLLTHVPDFISTIFSDHQTIAVALRPVQFATARPDNSDNNNNNNGGGERDITDAYTISDSLIRLLLTVDAIQVQMINAVLETLTELVGNCEDDCGTTSPENSSSLSLRLIRQLRWLDYLVDPQQLSEKLIEILSIVPPEIQREIISAIPDIISDDLQQSEVVAPVLIDLMRDVPELLMPVLDALSSIACPPHLLKQSKDSVVKYLRSASPKELPVILKFLFQSINLDSAAPVILRIRKYLDLRTVSYLSVAPSRAGASMDSRDSSGSEKIPEVLIFDAIAFALKSHKYLRDTWIKIIEGDSSPGAHITLDLFVLLMLHSITVCRKKVEAIFKAKVSPSSSAPGPYPPQILDTAIRQHPAASSCHHLSIFGLATHLFQSCPANSQATDSAHAMLVASFAVMSDYQRQELVGLLVTHISSGMPHEVLSSVHTLHDLAKRQPRVLRRFVVFIKSLLDYVDELPLPVIRCLFDTLGLLSCAGSGDETRAHSDGLFNELHIFVRKQLTSTSAKYNTIGVIGAVSLLKQLGGQQGQQPPPSAQSMDGSTAVAGTSNYSTSQAVAGVNARALRDAVKLLEMIIDAGRHQSWSFLAMAYDELARLVEFDRLHPQLEVWLKDNIASSFAELYLDDFDGLAQRYERSPWQVEVAFNLDGKDSEVVLDLFAQVTDPDGNVNAKAVQVLGASANSINGNNFSNCGDGGGGIHATALNADPSLLALEGNQSRSLHGSPVACLFPLFRLMQVCERVTSAGGNSLEEIDAILGCGVVLLPRKYPYQQPNLLFTSGGDGGDGGNDLEAEDDTSDAGMDVAAPAEFEWKCSQIIPGALAVTRQWPENMRLLTCCSLFLTINWFIELVNAFTHHPKDSAIISRLLWRVNQLSLLYIWLDELSDTVPNFDPTAMGLTAGMYAHEDLSPAITAGPALKSPVAKLSTGLTVGKREGGVHSSTIGANYSGFGEAKGKARQQNRPSSVTFDIDEFPLSQMDMLRDDDSDSVDGCGGGGSGTQGTKKGGGGMRRGTIGKKGEQPPKIWSLMLRELELNAFRVIEWGELSEDADISSDGGTLSAVRPTVSIGALNLLLGFLVKIAKSKLLQTTTKTPTSVGRKSKHPTLPGNELQSGTCGSSVANASPSYVFAELARLLPSVLRHLHSALDLYGNIEDLPSEMERVAGLVEFSLQYLESLLGWDGLANSSDSEKYRRAVLSALTLQGRKTSKSELSGLPLSILASRSFDYLLGLTESLQDIACVMRVNRILHCLAQWGSPASESKEARASMTTEDLERTMFHRLGMLAEQIMAGRWRNDDTLKPAEVEKLVLQRIEHSQDPLELIHDYSVQVLPNFLAGRSSGGSPGALGGEEWRHVLLTKSTLALFYRALSKALVDQISEFQTTNFDHTIYLPRLKTLIWSWHALVQLVKGRDDLRPLLQTCLKFGQRWVERFMRVVLPYLDTYFGAHYESIIALFGKLQKATRMLQVICGHGKIVRDKSMMAQVPVVRRALETFLFKVKALFDRHNVLSAFSLANLKHRNLAGEVVSSQMPEADEDEGLSSGSGGEEEEDDEREKAHVEGSGSRGRKRQYSSSRRRRRQHGQDTGSIAKVARQTTDRMRVSTPVGEEGEYTEDDEGEVEDVEI